MMRRISSGELVSAATNTSKSEVLWDMWLDMSTQVRRPPTNLLQKIFVCLTFNSVQVDALYVNLEWLKDLRNMSLELVAKIFLPVILDLILA